jgi:acyl-CoA hydrolase
VTIQREGVAALLDELRPGASVYLPGASGEILALADALALAPERATGVNFTSCLVPGMNEQLDYAGLTPSTRMTTFMLPAIMAPSLSERRLSLLPITYHEAAHYIAARSFDVALAHVAPPDAQGRCSLGIASDFATLAWRNAKRRVLVVNPAMPRLPRALSIPAAEADLLVTLESELVTQAERPAGASAEAIAARVAALVPDRAHVQAGIGGAPGAIWSQLAGHRDLVLRSGLVTPGFRLLSEAGALATQGDHVAGIALGPSEFYDWLAETDLMRFASTFETHGHSQLSALPRLISINGALEVDLFGQVNVEWQGQRLASGVGGGPDFMRAARRSQDGRSIIALPATAAGAGTSRIVCRLDRPSTSIARSDIDTVVTEHGVADLRDRGLDERAEALIAIAAPTFRDSLAQEWDALRRTMK